MNAWPALPLSEWRETCETLHRFTQVVGKIALAATPRVNHWWNAALHVTPRGLTTPLLLHGDDLFDAEFDLHAHVLRVRAGSGAAAELPLGGKSVASFHRELFALLDALGLPCRIWNVPVEIEDPIPLDEDEKHASYDREYVERFHRVLLLAHAAFTSFRAEFVGKCSPVHFFWGSFDLAVTRFSGRAAPPREGADAVTREAYSHEVSSVGFWPGDSRLALPAFYSYASPEPEGFREVVVAPAKAFYHPDLGGFYLHYDDVRAAADPEATLLDFCRSTYDAAADRGKWDRGSLERRG